MAAVWADSMIRFKQAGYKPKRTIKLALTCGEETTFAWNGAQYLTKTRPDLIAAGVVLNEGGGGRLNADGKQQTLAMQVGEKAAQNYTLTATNPGGHSSQPVPDNAIYQLADALEAIRAYEFPVKFSDTTRAFFTATAQSSPGPMGVAYDLKNNEIWVANYGDHTALVFPIARLVRELEGQGIAVLVDAAHAPGQVALDAGHRGLRKAPRDELAGDVVVEALHRVRRA